jgi:hypothetical protein
MHMKIHYSLIVAAAMFLLTSLPVAAQEGCTEAEPCPWVVTVNPSGFAEAESLNGTQGDWVRFTFFNDDDVGRTLYLDGYDREWRLEPDQLLDSEPIYLHTPGDFSLSDEFTGDARAVRIFVNDAIAVEEGEQQGITDPDLQNPRDIGSTSQSERTPGPALAVLAVVMLALVAMRRRGA